MNEGLCTFKAEGREFSALGAHVDENMAICYIDESRNCVTSWHGENLGTYQIVSEWQRYSAIHGPYTMRAVTLLLGGKTYHGRYGSDWSQLVRARRYSGKGS